MTQQIELELGAHSQDERSILAVNWNNFDNTAAENVQREANVGRNVSFWWCSEHVEYLYEDVAYQG